MSESERSTKGHEGEGWEAPRFNLEDTKGKNPNDTKKVPEGYHGDGWEASDFDSEETKGAHPDDAKKARKFIVEKNVHQISREARRIKPNLAEDILAKEPRDPNPDHYDTDTDKPWYGTKDKELG